MQTQKFTIIHLDSLTDYEKEYLKQIVDSYDFLGNICFMQVLTPTEKGIIGSLVKKGFVYDSFDGMHHEKGYELSNFFPNDDVLDYYGLEHY